MKQEYDHDIKLVVVGDGGVGKTSLLVSYTHNYFPGDYIPTVFEHYTANVVWSSSKNSHRNNSGSGSSSSSGKRARNISGHFSSSSSSSNNNSKSPSTPSRINNQGIGIGQRLDSLGSPSSPRTPNSDDKIVRLSLWDTAGQEDYDKLRPMSYPHTNVFMLCYSSVDPETALNIGRKWVPEIREHTPNVPIILVATKIDMRDHRSVVIKMNEKRTVPLSRDDGLQMVRDYKLDGFIECSALSKKGLMEAFDECIAAVVCPRDKKAAKRFKRRNKPTKKKAPWKKVCTLM